MGVKEASSALGMFLLFILNMAIGIVQVLAVFGGVQHWLDWHWIFSSLIAGLLVFVLRINLLNVVIGVLGAHYAWHWPWIWAIGLFFGMFVLFIVVSLLVGAGAKIMRW